MYESGIYFTSTLTMAGEIFRGRQTCWLHC